MKKITAILLALGMLLGACSGLAEDIWYTDGNVLYRGKHETVSTMPDFGETTLCTLYLQNITGTKAPEPFARYDYGDGIALTLLKDGSAIVQDQIGGVLYGLYYGTWSLNDAMRVEVQLDDTVLQLDNTHDDGIFAATEQCTLHFDRIPRVIPDPLAEIKPAASLQDYEGTWKMTHLHIYGLDIELTDKDALKRLNLLCTPEDLMLMVVQDGKVNLAGEDVGTMELDENGAGRCWDQGGDCWAYMDLTENGDICIHEDGTEDYVILRKMEN